MKKQQSGFTLIELIMVIVVLGILAAFAIPKFVDLGGDARRSVVKSAYGSIKSASAMAHSSFIAQSETAAASGQTVKIEDGTVALVYGYPAAVDVSGAIGIAKAAGITAEDFNIPGAASADGSITFTAKGAANPSTCGVKYIPASKVAPATVITPASVELVNKEGDPAGTSELSGC